MTDSFDIKAKAPFPAGALSNFALHSFTIDDVHCASMEGFLQTKEWGADPARSTVGKGHQLMSARGSARKMTKLIQKPHMTATPDHA